MENLTVQEQHRNNVLNREEIEKEGGGERERAMIESIIIMSTGMLGLRARGDFECTVRGKISEDDVLYKKN